MLKELNVPITLQLDVQDMHSILKRQNQMNMKQLPYDEQKL